MIWKNRKKINLSSLRKIKTIRTKTYANQNQMLTQPTVNLVAAYQGYHLMFTTDYVRTVLALGAVVSEITEIQ
jgi:hypothetical protein